MSCTAHVFSCRSLRLRAAFFFLDYASISYYGFASTVAYSYYLLPRLSLLDPSVMTPYLQSLGWHRVDYSMLMGLYSELVLPVAFVLAVTCTVACCKSRSEDCSYPFAIRTFVFAMPLSMACPVMIESMLFDLGGRTPLSSFTFTGDTSGCWWPPSSMSVRSRRGSILACLTL
ncbi:unnamed protein product [Staurois parvus]|uniref:Uncharacterized protein n=1 Tax=Staurois parvus TaxID=386267 RepID=A0ABN9AE66_9NEOB|nr:unnamed protein product [Staurois parvus]